MKPILVLSILATILGVAVNQTQATVVDLTSGVGASGSIDGALFFATDQQPAGTGFIDPFLRVQASPNEQGYNTDGGFPFDDKHPHNFQHSVLLDSLSAVNVNGVSYFKFMLDANQTGGNGNHTFSLTQLQLYTSNDPAQTTTAFKGDGTLPLGQLIYNMNSGGADNSVLTTATGSGKYDAIVYVPVDNFKTGDKYLYFYFAGKGNGGFEEWTAATAVAQVPEFATLFPVIGLMVAVLATHTLRRRQAMQLARHRQQ